VHHRGVPRDRDLPKTVDRLPGVRQHAQDKRLDRLGDGHSQGLEAAVGGGVGDARHDVVPEGVLRVQSGGVTELVGRPQVDDRGDHGGGPDVHDRSEQGVRAGDAARLRSLDHDLARFGGLDDPQGGRLVRRGRSHAHIARDTRSTCKPYAHRQTLGRHQDELVGARRLQGALGDDRTASAGPEPTARRGEFSPGKTGGLEQRRSVRHLRARVVREEGDRSASPAHDRSSRVGSGEAAAR
jgi:hypothetical protein